MRIKLLFLLFPIFFATLLAAALAAALPPTAGAGSHVIYVNAAATGSANGSSWSDAYTNVQDALAAAAPGAEIWVAQGVYYPDEGAGQVANAVTATFALTNGVALYGGFAGTETALNQRDPAVNVTVLSGDVDRNDATDANGVVTDTANIAGNNAHNVVTGSNTDDTAVLDGFTITAGQATSGFTPPNNTGGGMYNSNGDPTLINVTFSGNTAADGGGMYNDTSSPTLTDVVFSGNSAVVGGGMSSSNSSLALTNVTFSNNTASYSGGGMINYISSPTLTNVTFSGNSAGDDGGGMYNSSSSPTLTNVTFSSNAANINGGGMRNRNSSPTLTDVTFSGNSAASKGGGMFNSNSNPALTNVTFSGNSAGFGGGGMFNWHSSPTLTSVTFSGNSSNSTANYSGGGGMYNDTSSPTLTNVTFSGNSSNSTASYSGGGGMYNDASSPSLNDVTFSGNLASHSGGGMFNRYSRPALTNVVFSSNSANIYGGGMHNDITSSPTLTNVTFSSNVANTYGGGMSNNSSSPTLANVTFSGNSAVNGGGGMQNFSSSPVLTNVIIANSGNGDCVNNGASSVSASRSLIEDVGANACGLTDGINGNIVGQDPKLGPLTDFGGPGKQAFPLLPGSPAIDTGDNGSCPATDQRGATRPVDGDGDSAAVCDIGAYELGYFMAIRQEVDNAAPLPGQTVTFTIVVTNTDLTTTNGLISSALPVGLNFAGPLTLDDPSGTGAAGSQSPTLVSGLNLPPGGAVTVTFPVTVSYGLAAGTALSNTAVVSATELPLPASAASTLTVQNAPPIADAGPGQSVNSNEAAALDGSGSSDPNGDTLTYRWTQTGGPAVSLSDPTAVNPTFTAPGGPAVLTFTLTVTDSLGLAGAPDTVAVNVKQIMVYLPLINNAAANPAWAVTNGGGGNK